MTNISEVKTRISQFRGVDTTKLNPTQFAEGIAQMTELHQEIANYVAEDAKRQWEGMKLHRDLESIERNWSEVQATPAKHVTKLRESLSKTLKVVKAVTEAGLKYKAKLGEQIKQATKSAALIEELTTNGKGWMALAGKRKLQLDHLLKKYVTACEALDILAKQYHEDMTCVGGKLITLEFKEKAQTPEIQEALKNAAMAQDIIRIREQLEGKKPAEKVQEGKKPAEKVQEGKKPAAATEQPKPPTFMSETRNPRDWSEAAGIVRRLSESRLSDENGRPLGAAPAPEKPVAKAA
jgi:hypothetical protein